MEKSKLSKRTKFLSITLIVVTLLVVLFFISESLVNRYQTLIGEKNLMEKQIEQQKQKIDSLENIRLRQRDSLTIEIRNREFINEQLRYLLDNNQKLIKDIKERPIYIPKTLEGYTNYFNSRYETNENTNDENQILLQKNTTTKVIQDLENGDKAVEILPIQQEQLLAQTDIIKNLEYDKKDMKSLNTSLELSIKEYVVIENLLNQSNENLNKQVKTLKKRNTINKILVPIGLAVGALIGSQVSK